jgi:SnoaL-like domain
MQDRLTELLDKQAIMETIYRYAQGIDRRDTECLSSVFTADAVLHYGVGLYEGPASALIANWRVGKPSSFALTHHQVGNILIQFEGAGCASSITYLTAVHRALRDGTWVDETVRARYLDRLVKQDEVWRFAERTLVYDWSHIAPAGKSFWWEQPGAAALTGAHGLADPSVAFLAANR